MANIANITGSKRPIKPMVFELDINFPPDPLILLVNPETLEKRFISRVSESRVRWINRNDSGYILQAHHDELDVLSMSGRSALFYSQNGLTTRERRQSLGYDNIQKLVAIYRNNGVNFNRRPGRRGTNLMQSVGRVVITFNGYIYRGSFENLTITETQERPFNLEFSFEFKVTRTFNIITKFNF